MIKKLFPAKQIKEADNFTILHEPISSIDLMERASIAFCDWFCQHFTILQVKVIHVIAGTGNNGGDALAIARLLNQIGYQVTVCIVGDPQKGSQDFKANLSKLSQFGLPYTQLTTTEEFPSVSEKDILIDGIFGSGLSRALEGIHESVVQHINRSLGTVVSIDISSGLSPDITNWTKTAVVPDFTISFEIPKLSFFVPDYVDFVGELVIVPIGLQPDYFKNTQTKYFLIDEDISDLIPTRKKYMHKGSAGKTLLVAGSKGMMGAAVLSGKAALRAGTGLLTVHCPEIGYNIIQTSLPEAICLTDEHRDMITELDSSTDLSQFDAVAVGPGIQKSPETGEFLATLLKSANQPLIIDADALNIISDDKSLLNSVPENTILTPHPKEFERLVGSFDSYQERIEAQVEFSKKYKVMLVVKGAHSVITDTEGNIYFNTTGNPGMATAGSGDVLTGVILGFLGQGLKPLEALLLGVYIHGLSGDIGKKATGEHALIATDIIDNMPNALIESTVK